MSIGRWSEVRGQQQRNGSGGSRGHSLPEAACKEQTLGGVRGIRSNGQAFKSHATRNGLSVDL